MFPVLTIGPLTEDDEVAGVQNVLYGDAPADDIVREFHDSR